MPSFYETEIERQKKGGRVVDTALPILAALEIIATSATSKGRNTTANTMGILKDVQGAREKALDRALGRDKDAADKARDNTLLGFQKDTHERAKKTYEGEQAQKATAAKLRQKAIDKIVGKPAEVDTAGAILNPAIQGIEGLTDLEKIAAEADPIEFLINKLKPAPTQLVVGGDGTYEPVIRTTGKTPDGRTIKAPPRPVGSGKSLETIAAEAAARAAGAATGAATVTKPDKPATEDQSKAANFARRMELALSDLTELEKGGYNRASHEASARSSDWTPNFLNSKEGQRYSNAEKNFASANLRKESGAVIGVDEMAQQEALYFPRHGDDAETIEQKTRNRLQAYEGMKAAAGVHFGKIPSMIPGKKPASPNKGPSAEKKAMAQQALNDPEATPEEKAAAKRILGIP